MEYFTKIILIKEKVNSINLLQITQTQYEQLQTFESLFTFDELYLLIDIIFESIKELKTSTNIRIIMSFFLIKIHRYSSLISAGQLKNNLIEIAKK